MRPVLARGRGLRAPDGPEAARDVVRAAVAIPSWNLEGGGRDDHARPERGPRRPVRDGRGVCRGARSGPGQLPTAPPTTGLAGRGGRGRAGARRGRPGPSGPSAVAQHRPAGRGRPRPGARHRWGRERRRAGDHGRAEAGASAGPVQESTWHDDAPDQARRLHHGLSARGRRCLDRRAPAAPRLPHPALLSRRVRSHVPPVPRVRRRHRLQDRGRAERAGRTHLRREDQEPERGTRNSTFRVPSYGLRGRR